MRAVAMLSLAGAVALVIPTSGAGSPVRTAVEQPDADCGL